MTYHDKQYLDLVEHILQHGKQKQNRTGVDTIGVFGYQMRFDLSDNTIPLLTTKKMHTRAIIHEILWYLMGTGNIQYLKDNNVTIWDEWADGAGNLGPVYGEMWRKWPAYKSMGMQKKYVFGADELMVEWFCETTPIDQISNVVHKLRTNPLDRRMVVTAWNPGVLPDPSLSFEENVKKGKQALPPCHYSFQLYAEQLTDSERLKVFGSKFYNEDVFNVAKETNKSLTEVLTDVGVPLYRLSMLLNQRSCDVGLGVPFNIVQYSIMLRMFCEVSNMLPGEFIWNGGDVHIYSNHVPQLKEQIERVPYPSPTFEFAKKVTDIDDFKYNDFIVKDYLSHPTIKMDVAI